MPCGEPITQEPILGGLDAHNHRGTGRPIDFELILNMDGSEEAGYRRGMGWNRYLYDRECNGGYLNWDLHDQMWDSEQIVNIVPEVVPLDPVPAASPWHNWVIKLRTNRYALLKGKVRINISYESTLGNGTQEWETAVFGFAEHWAQLPMPGDAHDFVITELVGMAVSELTESPLTVPDLIPSEPVPGEFECDPFEGPERFEISLLESVTLSNGTRRLIAATRRAIYVNDDVAGNWKVVADGFGDNCPDDFDSTISFKMVQMGDIVVFTNNFDLVLGYNLNDGPAGPLHWMADYVQELQLIRVTQAAVIGKYKGFVLLGDITADGVRQSSTILWSDYNHPLGWVPGGESASGFHDFGHGERILKIEPIGGYIRVYTTQAIYDGETTTDDRIFAFTEIYRNKDSASLPVYPNAFIKADDQHYWLGADSIYTASISDRSPRRLDWQHVAAGVIFKGLKLVVIEGLPEMMSYGLIDQSRASLPVGFYDTIDKALYFSWPTVEGEPNNLSLCLWLAYGKASVINYGFTAGTTHIPDNAQSVRDWLDEHGICSSEDLRFPKEGTPCDLGTELIPFPNLWNEAEDVNAAMDPTGLIASLCDVCLDDVCRANESRDVRLLAAVTGEDISIKQLRECRHREVITTREYATFPDTSIGCYDLTGFTSGFQGRLNRYGTPMEKQTSRLEFNISTPDGEAELNAQIGVSDCADTTDWSLVSTRNACESSVWPVDEVKALRYGAKPRRGTAFPIEKRGQFVSFRLYVEGLNNCFEVSSTSIWLKPVGC